MIQLTFDAIAPLAARHGLSFAVAQRTPDDHAQIIERFYPPQDVHVGVTIGSRFGIFDGALGKALLASLEPGQAERLVRRRKLPAHTDATITDSRLNERVSRAHDGAVSIAGKPAAKITAPVTVASACPSTPICSTKSAMLGHDAMIVMDDADLNDAVWNRHLSERRTTIKGAPADPRD